MALTVHRAERADQLVPGLADLLRTPQEDPFATEVVIVPARGVERWLSQQLSHLLGNEPGRGDGVCAGVEFRSPWSLIAEVLGTRDEDPWAPEVLAWSVLRALDAVAGEAWAQVLTDHLGYEITDADERALRQGRRFAVARRLAGIFASYANQRPRLLTEWEAGGSGDGSGGELLSDLSWQPPLWRRVVADVGLPSPTTRHREVVDSLRQGTLPLELPARVSLFGHTRFSRPEADLLAALGEQRDVHLWLPHPSDALWRGPSAVELATARADDKSHYLVTNPLLATLGRDVRETQAVLEEAGIQDAPAIPSAPRPASLLGTVQSDVAADRRPTASRRADDSIQVHACHGPARQVEVLREVLLGLLEKDPTLEPRDIVVMCPDIDAYAPLLQAAFGLGEAVAGSHPGHRLRVMLADRSPTQTNPLLGVLGKILDLADGRAEATRVLDLLSEDPVRRRFGFSEDDLQQITRWVTNSGVRWGWDAPSRTRFGLDAFIQNTWEFGLDRLLAGVALSDDSDATLAHVSPYDDVSTTSISLAGRLAEAVDRLKSITQALAGAHPVSHWVDLLGTAVENLAEPEMGEEWQQAQLFRELAGFEDAAGEGTELRLGDIRALLHAQLGGRPTRANFRTGTLTICTLTPMRSVPHRVVCLLGLDDGVFPRGGHADGDDLLARLPLVGERDQRGADRQLFLDAIMAATDALVITYTGFNESTGAPRPPSVPLREFMDAVQATAPDFAPVEHRSQAFHPDYLAGPASTLPWSYDPAAVHAAQEAARVREPEPMLSDLELVPAAGEVIAVGDLIEAVLSPTRAFVRQRLGIDVPREADEISNDIPVELGGLTQWQVGERLLAALLRGRSREQALNTEWRQGAVPPGKYGWKTVNHDAYVAELLAGEFAGSLAGAEPRSLDVDIDLRDGRRVVGTISDIYNERLVRVSFSKLGARSRLRLWVELVAASAAAPGAWVGRVIGRDEKGTAAVRGTYRQVSDPHEVLHRLVQLRDLALTRAVPLEPESARMMAMLLLRNQRDWMVNKECGKLWRKHAGMAEIKQVFGRKPEWAEVTALSNAAGQPLLATEALHLWTPILQAEAE